MNENSTIVLNKMFDHFGLGEEGKEKKTIQKKKKYTITSKETKKDALSIGYSVDATRRRKEILVFKEELRVLNKMQTSAREISNNIYTKTRQKELLYAKKVLRDALQSSSLIHAL